MEVETAANVAARLQLSQVTASQEIENGFSEVFPKHVLIQELNTPLRMLVLADGLEKRGFTASQIEKILGGNFLRVFREVVDS